MEWGGLVVGAACSKMMFSITLAAGLLAYYLLEAVKRPVVACRGSRWREFLEAHVGLQGRYWPTPWCFEARCQTIVASLLRAVLPDIPYTREVLVLKDGGQVSLDWLMVDKDKSTADQHIDTTHTTNIDTKHHKDTMIEKNKNTATEENVDKITPKKTSSVENGSKIAKSTGDGGMWKGENRVKKLVVVLPGLTGSSQSEYVKGLVLSLKKSGFTCVVLNNRGLGGVRLMTTRTYCAANSDDLEEALDHLAATHPHASIFIIGISLGGMITGNYLATRGRKAASRVLAAAMLSAPWNMVDGLKGMERPGLNLLLNRYLASCLCELVDSMSYQLAGDNHEWDYKHVMKSQTMRDFDTRFTAKQFGFVDADDYYNASSLHTRIDNITVPVLCLTAADDPFQPITVLPTSAAAKSSHVAMLVTSRGGHIGFMDGLVPSPSHAYYSDRLLTQLVTAVFSNMAEMAEVRQEADQYRAAIYGPDQLLETSL